MKLTDFFPKKQSEPNETYIGLFLKEVDGAVYFIEGESKRLIDQEELRYSNGWENIAEDLDEAIYKLESRTKLSPNKAIFFIYSHIVDKKQREIKKAYLEKIKNLLKVLELTPLGYIECHEALADFLKKKEEVPLTAVLMEFDKTNLDILVYRAGKVVFEETVARTDNLIEDVLPVFERIRSQFVIPSRIILYNSTDLDTESSKIVTHRWKEDFFIQMPKTEVFHKEDLTSALIDVFMQQITTSKQVFVDSQESSEERSKNEVMGFVIGGDAVAPPVPVPPTRPFLNFMPFVEKFNDFIRSVKMPQISFSLSNPLLPIVGITLILLATLSLEFFFHKADVQVFLPSKQIKKRIRTDDLTIKAGSQTVSFSESKATSGKKEIGERAKGSVVVYNSSLSESKTFPKGTALISTNNLKFSLDNDIKIASASGDASSINSSTTKAAVTAGNIGAEFNLASGTKFTIEDQPSSVVIAKNDASFSGGSKKQIRTVARQDTEDLKDKVENEAKEFTKKNISAKLGKEAKIVEDLTKINLKDINFSKEIGEESDRLDIRSKAGIAYFFYKEKELIDLLAPRLKDDKTKDLVLDKTKMTYKIDKVQIDKKKYILDISATGRLTSGVDKKELLSSMIAKNTESLERTMNKKYRAIELEFIVDHPISPLRKWMPVFKRNINLKISYK